MADFKEVIIKEPVSTNPHTGNKEVRTYQENHVCVDNTTTTLLGANETFTGEWQDCLNYQEVNVSIVSDKNSAMNGLVFQWSADGINIGDTDVYSYYTASGGTNYTPNPAFRYVRIVYTNGSQAQTSFSLQTILRRSMTGGSFHRIDSTLKDDSDGRLQIVVPKLRTAQNNYISQAATSAGNAKISIEEIEANVNIARSSIQTDGTQKTQLVNSAGDNMEDSLYPESLVTLDLVHHRIHDGKAYFYEDVVALGNGAVQDYLITVTDGGVKSHFGYEITFNDGAGTMELYEATDKNGTTIQTVFNKFRDSGNTSNGTIHKGVSGGTTDGTKICWRYIGSGKTSGASAGSSQEYILKENTKYILRLTNLTTLTNNLSIDLLWYET